MPDDIDNAPAFHRLEISPEGAERLVLRFTDADVSASPADGGELAIEFELRGNDAALAAWQPSVRRIEGILVIGEEAGPVKVTELRARLPVAIRDLEVHGKTGDIESRGLSIGLLAETFSGRVRVSGAASLEARSTEGEIEIEATGLSDLRTATGRIRAVSPEGRMTARSESGDIEVEDSPADLYLETDSGEISVTRPRGRVRAVSQAGDIEIEAPGPFGGGEANTASGHIGLSLEGASLELRAETLSGRLRTPNGEVGNNTGPRRAALTVAGGGRRLHAKSVSGDIEIDY
jgi:DUF4097 and DUF4098 domain-containing protein YvlB